MSQTATLTKEVHLCARCKAIVEEESRELTLAPAPAPSVPDVPEAVAVEPSAEDRSSDAPVAEDRSSDAPTSETRLAALTEPAPPAFVHDSVAKDPFAPVRGATEPAPPPSAISNDDLRTAPRRKLEVNVGIQSDSHFFAGLSGDVSKGGLFVATYAEVPLGGKVVLDFELPNGVIVVEGTVRWQRVATDNAVPGFGIQFENVPKETMALIERFCKARPPLYYDQADDDL